MLIFLIFMFLCIVVCFFLVILSLLHLFPFWVSMPLLLLSIIIFTHTINERHRFKGFRPSR
ncbi:hypothetical protein Bcell_2899 [Evansella cellulosilytica DSM 2522]|uniref:Uncharacterized protein n=1 Tax=Evansella cellulosilytica (strain ATCC 21833 / DSM 2522 / FERM P-1141 / JCM 9156 / N-4) TaxID=649639 RepID=E6TX61_EVAC2|nr:hypothetical protein Bcell_2899 [Evansella cellulosilytica DSM 2522]